MRALERMGMGALRRLVGPLLFAACFFYIGFHALNGDRGIYALLKEQRKLELTVAETGRVSDSRRELEHRVRMLNSESLDIDLLDEEARRVLGYAGENEAVALP